MLSARLTGDAVMITTVFEQILGFKEICVDQVELQEKRINIYCSSTLKESLCPTCLKKRQQVNQTYQRPIRDLSITGKEVYLYLTQRQFYCPDCDRYFTERFSFVESSKTMTKRYEKYVYELCKNTTLQKVSAQENIVWNTLDDIFKRYSEKELNQARKESSKVRVVGMDEFAMKKGHKDFATVIVDLEHIEIIDILDYRDKEKLINYFNQKGLQWCHQVEVFCSDMWEGFISTAQAVFPQAVIVVDRFHFFQYMNKAVDNQRKHLRKMCKDYDEFKHLKWALLKNRSALTEDEKKKLKQAFFLSPELKALYEQKEKLRDIFEQHLTKEQAQQQIDQWIENAKKLNNKYLNNCLKTFNNSKDYVLNYFTYRFTTSLIEGINNSIKTIKRMCFGFRNFQNFKNRVLLSFI